MQMLCEREKKKLKNEGHNLNGVNVASYHKTLQLSLSHKILAIKIEDKCSPFTETASCKNTYKFVF